jgi:hypothetical protein
VSAVFAPSEGKRQLSSALIGFAKYENRVVNTRNELGKNPYYKFADVG